MQDAEKTTRDGDSSSNLAGLRLESRHAGLGLMGLGRTWQSAQLDMELKFA